MNKVKALWNKLPDHAKRLVHTFWQVAGGVLLTHLLAAHSSRDVQSAFTVAFSTGFAALKAAVVSSLSAS